MKKSILFIFAVLFFGFAQAQAPCQASFSYQANPGSTVFSLQGSAYSLDSMPINVTSWTWTVGNMTLSGQNTTFTANSAGPFYVCLFIQTDNNCSTSFCDTVYIGGSNPCTLNVYGTVVNATSVSSNDGMIDIIAMNGTLPYSYSWSNGSVSEDLDNIAPGLYDVTVTDANGCIVTEYFSVNSVDSLPQDSMIQITVLTTNNTAIGAPCNGTASIIVTGGTPPYTYYFSNSVMSGSLLSGLCPGTYTVVVTDASGLSATAVFTIASDTNPNDSTLYVSIFSGYSPNNVGCSAYAEASVLGGTSPYSYIWDDGTTTNTIQGLCAGFYCVTVTDVNGLIASACVNVYNYDSTFVYPEDTLASQLDTCITTILIDSAFVGGIYTNSTGTFVNWVLILNGDTLYLDQNYIVTTPGTYLFTLVINCNGAKDLFALSDVYTVTQEELTITEILNQEMNTDVMLYPNPVSDKLNVVCAKNISDVQIYDAIGNIVLISGNSNIDVKYLAGGVYFVKINFADHTSSIRKIIK